MRHRNVLLAATAIALCGAAGLRAQTAGHDKPTPTSRARASQGPSLSRNVNKAQAPSSSSRSTPRD